jgi:hypothetical protein
MPEAARLVTAEELERFPSEDRRYELVEGRLVAVTPVTLKETDVLDLSEVVDSFSCVVREIFD